MEDNFLKLIRRVTNWYKNFSYDPQRNGEYALIKKLDLQDEAVIFDIGANRGDWSKFCIDLNASYNLHCFEIEYNNFEKLQERFGSKKTVKVNGVGLSDESRQVMLRTFDHKDTLNTLVVSLSLHDLKNSQVTEVSVIKGDDYCKENGIQRINFMKIDVEGHEMSVLRGFSDLFKVGLIDIVQFEYGHANGEAGFLMKHFYEFFEAFNYTVGRLSKRGVAFQQFSYELNNFDSGPNFVAVRNGLDSTIDRIKT